jgi:cysteine desulfurase/selenocysteine lyase
MGIGVLFGRAELLEAMPPWQGGGEMISKVTYQDSSWNVPPLKFEAGTPNVEGAIGLHAAMDFLDEVGRERIAAHDLLLAQQTMQALLEVPRVRILGVPPGSPSEHAGAVSFAVDGIHAHDVVSLMDQRGVALRGGHHCNQPLMKKLGVPATARASFYFYNTPEEIALFAAALRETVHFFCGEATP